MSAAKLDTIARLAPLHGLELPAVVENAGLERAAPSDVDGSRGASRDGSRGDGLGDRLAVAFGREAPRLLDIGVGNGEATIAWAEEHPGWDVVAAEVHRPSVAATFAAVDEAGLANVRIAELDARLILDAAGPGDLAAVRILFPDPWPKRRHRSRRLVNAELVARIATVLPVDGWVEVVTDWADYADEVRQAIAGEPRLDVDELAEPSLRPTTVYEGRGVDAGRPPLAVVARRRGRRHDPAPAG